ncbi:serine hydrolase domain-containing protein [Pseudohongiella spirulinae]|uniref:Carboxylesterase n=1 Tax=Pseudohongiella spirulinae TaxID=1249552 RepID=A0A0S2KDZ1_9GAMM|nr:serine hydrolase domain-containing protein [Pseudohongiella spirulinae]ALO46534.1 Carboxylesterase [Pseudohongiella spirulinae]
MLISQRTSAFKKWLNTSALTLALSALSLSAWSHDTSWPVEADGASAAGFSQATIDRLDAAMEKIVSDNDVAGMVWLLAKDGKVATYETAGYASIEDNRPMTKDTLFRIYSMTKPVTGVALMMLHEQGLWDFDDPVSKFVPEFENLQVMVSYDESGAMQLEPLTRQPTMRELLNHSAGFGYGLGGNDPVNEAFRDKGVLASSDLNELIDKVADIPLLYQPGEQWVYSIAVDIQGYIVEKLSGMPFGEFLDQKIFNPLGMHDTAFYVKAEDKHRFADVYRWEASQGKLMRNEERPDRPSYLDSTRLESGGGGLVSSTHDYARFLQMLVNGGELDGRRILGPQSVDMMRSNTLRDGLLLRGTDTRPGQAGQGFGVDFAVIFDPVAAGSVQGEGTYYWSGAAGTWFWIDPVHDMYFIGMIQAQGGTRPGAANMRGIAVDIIYEGLK